MPEHSPLPWRKPKPGTETMRGDIICARKNAGIVTVCETYTGDAKTSVHSDEAAANRDLILRAVNSHDALYKALDDLVYQLEQCKKFPELGSGDLDSISLYEAQAALAKAKEQP